MFKLSEKSLSKLEGVHPDLVELAHQAIKITPFDFGITSGVRTMSEQMAMVEKGASKTMRSKHLIQPTGYAHAFDYCVYVGNAITWDSRFFRPVAQAFITTAIEMGVKIEMGGLWRTVEDWPHVQYAGAVER